MADYLYLATIAAFIQVTLPNISSRPISIPRSLMLVSGNLSSLEAEATSDPGFGGRNSLEIEDI